MTERERSFEFVLLELTQRRDNLNILIRGLTEHMKASGMAISNDQHGSLSSSIRGIIHDAGPQGTSVREIYDALTERHGPIRKPSVRSILANYKKKGYLNHDDGRYRVAGLFPEDVL